MRKFEFLISCGLVGAVLVALSVPGPAMAHVRLNAPNGGEIVDAGSVFTVEWQILIGHNLQNWDLWYSTTSSTGPWIDIAMNLPPGSGAVGSVHTSEWTIPDTLSGEAWARVRMDNNGTDYFDVSNASFTIVPVVAPGCDFDGNGSCDITDLNDMLAVGPVASGVPVTPGVDDQFDLDGNGTIDNADVDVWLADAADLDGRITPYQRGDANLDGGVDEGDFLLWNAGRFATTLLWDGGDFNGDGVNDGQDYILWNAAKVVSSNAVAVPEPTGVIAWLWVFLAAAFRSRRTRQD